MNFPKFLKVGIIPIFEQNSTRKRIIGYKRLYERLVGLYSKALGFSYEVVPGMDGEFGRQLPNGSFTGLIGMLEREEVDIALSDIGISEVRMKVVGFTYPYTIDSFNFVTKMPAYKPKFLSLVYPFTINVWLSILGCILVMSLVFFAFQHKKFTYQRILLKTFGNFLSQTSIFPAKKLSGQILVILWSSGTMFITLSYTAVLLSFLTLPLREQGIRNIPELSKGISYGSCISTTIKGNFLPEILARADEEYLRIIGTDLQKRSILITEIENSILFPKEKEKIVVIAPKSYITYLKSKYFISEDSFFSLLFSVPFRKSFCCAKKLDTATHRIVASGLHKKVSDEEDFLTALTELSHKGIEEEHDFKLNLIDVSGAFMCLIIGYILSLFTFILEIIKDRFI